MRLVLSLLICGLLQAALAWGDHLDNIYFRATRGSASHVFIKTVVTEIPSPTKRGEPLIEETRYGLILERGARNAALFRIETLEDGTQSWIQIFQGSNNLLTADPTQNATYSGLVTKRASGTVLTLTPTKFGKSVGCVAVIEGRGSNKLAWKSMPQSGEFDSRFGRIDVTPDVIAGRFKVDGEEYNGMFSIEPFIDGLAILRSHDIDPEASSGRSVDDGITAIVVALRHRDRVLKVFNDDYTELRFVTLKAGQMSCYSSSSAVNND